MTSKRMQMKLVVAAVSLAAAACSVNESGKIQCIDDSSCPRDYPVCGGGFCVEGTSTTQNSVAVIGVPGKQSTDPVRGTVTVQVAARAASGVASVALTSGTQSFPGTASGTPGVFNVAVDTTKLADGSVTLTATVTAGDGTSVTASSTIVVDNTPPGMTVAAAVTPAEARAGTLALLDVTPSEPLSSLSATVKNSANGSEGLMAEVSPPTGTTRHLGFSVTKDVTDTYTVTLTPTDLAGNVGAPVTRSFNVHASFALGTLTLTGAATRNGLQVVSGVTGKKTLSGQFTVPGTVALGSNVPVVSLSIGSATRHPTATPGAPGTWIFTYDVVAGDVEGLATVSVTATDVAGNTASSTATFQIDLTPPTIQGGSAGVSVSPGTLGNSAAGTSVSIGFVVSEVPAALTVLVNSNSAHVTCPNPPTSTAISCTYAVQPGDVPSLPGVVVPIGITVSASDAVGNAATTANASFSIDTTVPVLSGLATNPTFVKLDGKVTITGSSSRPLSSVVITGGLVLGDSSPVFCAVAGTTFTCVITAGNGNGTANPTLSAFDTLNNFGTATAPLYTVDNIRPCAGSACTFTASPQVVTNGQALTISGTANETVVAGTVTSFVGSGPCSIASGTVVTCVINVSGPPGTNLGTANVTLVDRAGNQQTNLLANFAVRIGATATLLPNGKVLIAGGSTGGTAATALETAEIFDPSSGTFSAPAATGTNTSAVMIGGDKLLTGGGTAVPRMNHTATLLSTGMVLIAGGSNNSSAQLQSADIYDPAQDGFLSTTSTPTGPGLLKAARSQHTATALPDGRVLLAGSSGTACAGCPPSSIEFFDPGTRTFPTLQVDKLVASGRAQGTATFVSNSTDGTVLIAGGAGTDKSVDVFDVAAGAVSNVATVLKAARTGHSATLLDNGKILLFGGVSGVASAEILSPSASGTTPSSVNTPAPPNSARIGHTSTLLSTGKVLIAGGSTTPTGAALTTAELFDPTTNAFALTQQTMSVGRFQGVAAFLFTGKALLAGGNTTTANAQLFDP